MKYRALLLSFAVLAGCAQAGSGSDIHPADPGDDDGGGGGGGGGTGSDTGGGGTGSGGGGGTGCTPQTQNLLVNGAFDMNPMGMGWSEEPISAMYPLITDSTTLVQSAPNVAWLGGIAQANAIDDIYQDIDVPAGATDVTLTGYYQIKTAETGTAANDEVVVGLLDADGNVLETMMDMTNTDATTDWAEINIPLMDAYAGETIELVIASQSNATKATSFYFDSLALSATICE